MRIPSLKNEQHCSIMGIHSQKRKQSRSVLANGVPITEQFCSVFGKSKRYHYPNINLRLMQKY